MKTAIQTNSKRKYASVVSYPNCRVCRLTPLISEEDRTVGICEACKNKPKQKGRDVVLAAYKADPKASLRELAAVCNLSAPTVQYHLQLLIEQGQVEPRRDTRHNRNTNAARKAQLSANKKPSEMTLEERIDAIVERNKANGNVDVPQHDVVRHINRPLNMRSGGRLG